MGGGSRVGTSQSLTRISKTRDLPYEEVGAAMLSDRSPSIDLGVMNQNVAFIV